MEAELANRLINSDLDIPLADAERLESHHNGKRCILTGLTPTRGALEWAHLIPGCVESVRAKLVSHIFVFLVCVHHVDSHWRLIIIITNRYRQYARGSCVSLVPVRIRSKT